MICWNIRGITSKIFADDIQHLLFSNDIVMLTETHTDEINIHTIFIIQSQVLFIKDFQMIFVHPNAPAPSGGICIYIKRDLKYVHFYIYFFFCNISF